jgi:hypothetical protein
MSLNPLSADAICSTVTENSHLTTLTAELSLRSCCSCSTVHISLLLHRHRKFFNTGSFAKFIFCLSSRAITSLLITHTIVEFVARFLCPFAVFMAERKSEKKHSSSGRSESGESHRRHRSRSAVWSPILRRLLLTSP